MLYLFVGAIVVVPFLIVLIMKSKQPTSSGERYLAPTLQGALFGGKSTREHCHRMAAISCAFGHSLSLSSQDIARLKTLALYHDIGKVAIPDSILTKPTRLTELEWEVVQKHPETGYYLALSHPELAFIAPEIHAHHERWDGAGYPQGLRGMEIPLLARIISIIDAFDVMTSGRVYKIAMSRSQASEEIQACSGTQFDPNLAALFIRTVVSETRDSCAS